ncbi:PEP-CTERM sorting domain-containing protein [Methylobacillus caricis]|uniref:PEP-CTERM sorting domain-containing protein n=1 Tax=Methylobacillus caricis TaxID=1971611 RepID=UPI001CFFBE45|nr:PEP-CTERM sorting domain-containing protein [Methylobacillus caricis]MCB5188888.1 PEP-CTERM sorting domain-containing protein [Methylobacillus caricis]
MTKAALKMKVIASLVLVFAGNAFADTYTNVPSGANANLPFAYFGNAANPSGDSPKVGEVFSLTSEATLSSFSFYAIGNISSSLQLNVAQWNPDTNALNQATNFVGPILLTTTGAADLTYNSTGGYTTISFDNLGLNLNSDIKYIAYLTSNDPTVTGIQLSRTQTAADTSGFGVGSAYLSNIPDNGWQLPFNGFLSLQYTAITAAVPEPESYAMLLVGLGLIGATVKRRKAIQS